MQSRKMHSVLKKKQTQEEKRKGTATVRSSTGIQFSCSVVSNSLRPYELQHARPPVHHQLPEFT